MATLQLPSRDRLGSLVAAAVDTAARFLQALHRHRADGTSQISLRSGGVHSSTAAPAPALPLACTIGAAGCSGGCQVPALRAAQHHGRAMGHGSRPAGATWQRL